MRNHGTVSIEANKDGVKFSCNGDIGSGAVTLRSHTNVEKPSENIDIELTEPVSLTFSLKYLVNFCKAAALSGQVKIGLSADLPVMVEYNLSGSSYLRFYLAPKVRLFFFVTDPSVQCVVRLLTIGCYRSVRTSKQTDYAWGIVFTTLCLFHQGAAPGFLVVGLESQHGIWKRNMYLEMSPHSAWDGLGKCQAHDLGEMAGAQCRSKTHATLSSK